MNKEYICLDGKAIIEDENGNKKIEDYNDNLDEILVQENLIETLEETIKELEKKDKSLDKIKKMKSFKPWGLVMLCYLVVFPLGMLYTDSMLKLIGDVSANYFNIKLASICIFGVFIPSGIICNDYMSFKYNKKLANGTEKELKYAREQLVLEKEKLDTLKSEKMNKKENTEIKVIKVHDLERLKNLKENLEMHFNLGYINDKESQLVLKKKK